MTRSVVCLNVLDHPAPSRAGFSLPQDGSPRLASYHPNMAVAAQKLRIGQLVEVDGRLYDVVSDKEGGVTLEPAITVSSDEIIARTGGRRATPEEFQAWFGDIPSDDEG
jgi:hypothetical protein